MAYGGGGGAGKGFAGTWRGPWWEQLEQGWRPFSLHAVHFRALKESVKQLRNTDILLPWHIGHGTKANPPHVWHVSGCWTLYNQTEKQRKIWVDLNEMPDPCAHSLWNTIWVMLYLFNKIRQMQAWLAMILGWSAHCLRKYTIMFCFVLKAFAIIDGTQSVNCLLNLSQEDVTVLHILYECIQCESYKNRQCFEKSKHEGQILNGMRWHKFCVNGMSL